MYFRNQFKPSNLYRIHVILENKSVSQRSELKYILSSNSVYKTSLLSTRHRIYQFSTCISNVSCIHFLRIWNLVIFHFFIISKERLVGILKKYLLVIFFQGLVHWEIWRYTHCIGCRKKKNLLRTSNFMLFKCMICDCRIL